MSRFRSRDDTFRTGEENACGQSFRLRHGLGFDDLVFQQLAHDRTGSVIAQTSGVNVRRVEVVSQRIHREQRSEACHVAEVVLELTARQLGTRLGFDGDYAGIFTFGQVIAQEREADAGEVAASSEATDHHVRVLPEQLHLFHGLLADDRLVQQYVVQNRTQTVTGILRILQRHFYGFGDRHAQTARIVGVLCKGGPSGGCNFARRGIHVCAPGVHHQLAVGFLVEAHLDHEDFQVDAEVLRSH